MGIFLIVFGVLLVLVGIVVFYAIAQYNALVRARNLNEESWRQVDVELNRRYDLIPNLIETVAAYARHERDTLESVVELRNQAAALASQGATEERAAAEQQLSGAIRSLLVTVEAYPALQANANFRDLQQQLATTEDRIANARRYYNANVRNYNNRVETFPFSLVAGFGHFTRGTYFEVEDAVARRAPQVDFGALSGSAPTSRLGDATATQRPDDTPALTSRSGPPAPEQTPPDRYAWSTPNFGVRSGPTNDDQATTDRFGRPLDPPAPEYRAPLSAWPDPFERPSSSSGSSSYGQSGSYDQPGPYGQSGSYGQPGTYGQPDSDRQPD
jgi:LemA protein